MKLWNHLLHLIIICIISFSCENPENLGETILAGELFGKVQTFDEFGELLPDHSGVEVVLDGTDPLVATTTDAGGKFVFADVRSGTYNLAFSKDGFQSKIIFSYQFLGGNVPTYFSQAVYLSQVSTTVITNFKISVTNENNPDSTRYSMVRVEYEVSPASTSEKQRRLVTFLSASDKVTMHDYDYQLNLGNGGVDIIKIDKLNGPSNHYAIAYPVPAFCNPYYDPFLEIYNFSCYGSPSRVVSFTVP